MKNSSFKSQQNAIVKRTLNLKEFIVNYIAPANIENNDLDVFPVNEK
ncbi:hypothetical protein [Pseudalgibacter alginicilyticus]|nr:hypothetical protein [Pseudalgibacter alginicilyticus]